MHPGASAYSLTSGVYLADAPGSIPTLVYIRPICIGRTLPTQGIVGGGGDAGDVGGCQGFVATDVFDEDGEGVAGAVGEGYVSHVVVGDEDAAVLGVARAGLVANRDAFLAAERRDNTVGAGLALPEGGGDEGLFVRADEAVGLSLIHI